MVLGQSKDLDAEEDTGDEVRHRRSYTGDPSPTGSRQKSPKTIVMQKP